MLSVGALVVDFDGTVCAADISEALLEAFGDPSWSAFDQAADRGELGLREAAHHQVAMLRATREELLAFAVATARVDPTFPPFVAWAGAQGLPLTVVSDGFGFYVRPVLEAAGLGHLSVLTNELVGDEPPFSLRHPHGHPECAGCGTCKMLAVCAARALHGPVAFVGEGQSDRYGALYADAVFAKDALAAICAADGVPALPWRSFDDVRAALEALAALPGPLAPARCPGWRPA